ncbi:hypothetical protein NE237_019375 [Protea cynaroides]|uniref:Uncharacterized protein n=1 Tax=Protea cynaroides TaxID=273540 RepID=A0A9Q0KBN9_9MAGN|nr:hypothetical protein NE237_019375 [Protea cynaroides]
MAESNIDWADKLPYALWAYRTSIRTSTRAKPYLLVYGMEVVLPVEIEVPSLRVLMECKIPKAEWLQSRYDELNFVDDRRMKAVDNVKKYQQIMAATFNKNVRVRHLTVGDLVLKEQRAPVYDPRGMFCPNWSRLFIVKEILPRKAIRLVNMEGIELQYLTNLDQEKRYYV